MSLQISRRLTLRIPTVQQVIFVSLALLIAVSTLLEISSLNVHAAPTRYAQTGWLNPHEQMTDAYGLSLDSNGNRYIAEMCGDYKVQKYSPTGQLLMKFGPNDWSSDPDSLGCTYDTAVDSRGIIYVSDGDNYRVQVYDPNGNFLRTIGGVNGTGNGEFNYTYGIAVDSQDNLYVVDDQRIQKFDKDGNFVQVISSPGMTITSSGGYTSSSLGQIAIDKADNIYVVEAGNSSLAQVQKFSSTGTLLATFGTYNASSSNPTPGAMAYPCAIAVDSLGNVFVDDANYINIFNSAGVAQSKTYVGEPNVEDPGDIVDMTFDSNDNLQLIDNRPNRLFTLTHNLQFVSEVGQSGVKPGHFYGPLGIFRDESAGKMYVSDGVNARVQVFDLNNNYLSSFGSYGSSVGQLSRPEHISKNPLNSNLYVNNFNGIDIFTPSGTSVSRLTGFGSAGATFDAAGNMYTSNPESTYPSYVPGYVNVRDNNGTILKTFGNSGDPTTGGIRRATKIALDTTGNIYVLDGSSNYVQIYAPDGTFLRNFSGQFNQPNDLWVASDGTIYVADTGNGRIQIFSSTGTLLDQFGSQGFGPGKLYYPQAFTVGSDGTFYIADDQNNFVAVYKPSSDTAPSAPTNFTVSNNTAASWTVPSDTGGQPLVSYTLRYKQTSASYWSEARLPATATTYSFGTMPSGTYQYELTASNSAGESVAALPGTGSTTPSSPLAVSTSSPASNTLTASWQAPASDGGSALTSYLLEYKPATSLTWTQVALSPSATNHTLTGVPAGSYDIRVSAVNTNGVSMPSATSTTIVTDAATTTPTTPPISSSPIPPATSPTVPIGSPIITAPISPYIAPPASTQSNSEQPADSTATPATSSLQAQQDPAKPGTVTLTWQPPAGETPTSYVIEYRSATIPDSDTTTPWRQATVAEPGNHSATFSLPIGNFVVRVAALLPGDAPRIILGVAHITIPNTSATIVPATSSPTTPATSPLVAICIGLVAFAILGLIPFLIWKRRRRKQASSADLPPRWQ